MGMMAFQRLDVYRCSIEFLAKTIEWRELPRGNGPLADQLRRAASSVPLNIAEGVGRASDPDGARHFSIARGSAMECAAIIDTLHVLGVIDDPGHLAATDLLERIVSMLTKLCRPSPTRS